MNTFGPGVDGYWSSISFQMYNYLIRRAETHFAKEREAKAGLDTPEKIHTHADRMRTFFLDALGQIPDDGSELNVRTTGTLEFDGFTIEKIIYDSLKNFPVTANLYMPQAAVKRPAPAVVLCSGHGLEAKAYPNYHRQAMLLAQNGMVVLAFDPVGQGERLQLIDRATGAQTITWGTREHSYIGLACELLGTNIARYFIRDAVRGVDVLCSRPQVDPARIGVTGSSGGGTQTCLLMLAEPRLAAAAPSCYVTERLTYMKAFHAHDAEQNWFGHIPAQFNYADFLAVFAPKPVLLVGVEYDFFPLEGLQKTYEIGKQLYKTMGAEDRCDLVLDRHVHELTEPSRKAITAFFSRAFLNKDPETLQVSESLIQTPQQLQCTRSGQVLMDQPDVPNLMQVVARGVPTRPNLTGPGLREHVRKTVLDGREKCDLHPRVIHELEHQNFHVEKMFFFTEPDLVLTAMLVKPNGSAGKLPATLIAFPQGTDTLQNDFVLADFRGRWTGGGVLLFLDVRGIGGAKPADDSSPKTVYGTQFKIATFAWMLGDNLAAMRAYDLLRGLELLRARSDVDPSRISIVGRDNLALPALLAAVGDGKTKSNEFQNLPTSYGQAIRETFYDRKVINEGSVIRGMSAQFDVKDLLELV